MACPPAATISQVSLGASIRIGFNPVSKPEVIPSSEACPVPSPVLGHPIPIGAHSSEGNKISAYGGGASQTGQTSIESSSNIGQSTSAPPTTGSHPGPQTKHTVDGSKIWDIKRQNSLQSDSPAPLGRSHAPIIEEELLSETRKVSTPPQTKHTPSPPQTNRDPSPSQNVVLNSTVAKETSQTGRGGAVQLTSSGDMQTGPQLHHHNSTNPFDSDEEVVPHAQSSPSPTLEARGVASPPHPSPPISHSTPSGGKVMSRSLERSPVMPTKGHCRSKSQDLRKASNVPTPSKPSDPFDEDTPPPPPRSSSKRTSWTAFTSRGQQGTSLKSWHTSSGTPLGSHPRVPSPNERPPSSDLQQR